MLVSVCQAFDVTALGSELASLSVPRATVLVSVSQALDLTFRCGTEACAFIPRGNRSGERISEWPCHLEWQQPHTFLGPNNSHVHEGI